MFLSICFLPVFKNNLFFEQWFLYRTQGNEAFFEANMFGIFRVIRLGWKIVHQVAFALKV